MPMLSATYPKVAFFALTRHRFLLWQHRLRSNGGYSSLFQGKFSTILPSLWAYSTMILASNIGAHYVRPQKSASKKSGNSIMAALSWTPLVTHGLFFADKKPITDMASHSSNVWDFVCAYSLILPLFGILSFFSVVFRCFVHQTVYFIIIRLLLSLLTCRITCGGGGPVPFRVCNLMSSSANGTILAITSSMFHGSRVSFNICA